MVAWLEHAECQLQAVDQVFFAVHGSEMPDLDRLNLNSKLCLVVGTRLLSIFMTKQSLEFRNRSSRLSNLGDGKSSNLLNLFFSVSVRIEFELAEILVLYIF